VLGREALCTTAANAEPGNLRAPSALQLTDPLARRVGDLSPRGNADSYLPWLALSYSGLVLFSAELMCGSGGGQVSRNMVCKGHGQERPVVAIADRFRCGEDHAEDIDR
jgi:hypothetical protein